ncbi:MAG TPA: TauD/TfdA family dioxygenase [Acidimicrobiales bacterium]
MATRTSLEVRPLTPTIGAEVRGVNLATASDDPELIGAIADALHEHLVLFFRDQHDLTPDAQIRFAKCFGPIEHHAFAKPHPDHPELVVLDQTTPEKDGANSWHSDSSFMEQPALGSVLRAVQLPPLGGDTCWASMYAAYDALSPRMQALLDGCSALHDIIGPLEKAIAGGHSTGTDLEAIRRAWPPVEHPVVRTHPVTGRKCLYVNNNFTTRILGITKEESDVLLPYLLQHVQRPDFQVRLHWEPGTVAFWDNRCTQHYAVPDYSGHRRVMHRVTITGERPR